MWREIGLIRRLARWLGLDGESPPNVLERGLLARAKAEASKDTRSALERLGYIDPATRKETS